MDNYKIKVKDEAESKEAQELFFELGGKWKDSGKVILEYDPGMPFFYLDGEVLHKGSSIHNYQVCDRKELTLPQLRDLVVLKRNDVKDATHRDKRDESIYLTSDKVIYYWYGEWCKSAINKSNDYEDYIANSLTPITQPQDPALISGAEAMIAALDGKHVVWQWADGCVNWQAFNDEEWTVDDLKSDRYHFKIVPQTIKVELEIPAPYKAKIGGRDDTSFVLNVGRHQYCYKTEEDYTKARDALEAVFDAAVRGTNS